MSEAKEKKKMALSTKIFIGLGLGLVVGLFFGEKAAWLSYVGMGFIKILQMTILPYIMVSIIKGIGGLSAEQAKSLAVRGGAAIFLLWSICAGLVLLIPLVYPELKSASFFSASQVSAPKEINYFDLYIPSNPFFSLSSSAVPAVVIFSLAIGVALMTIKNKGVFMENLNVLNDAIGKLTKSLVQLSPIGVFAITANAAGTISVDEIQRLQVYLITYVGSCLLLTFAILPGVICAITGFKYKDVMGFIKDPLITAFTLDNLFIVLPLLSEGVKKILDKHKQLSEDNDELADVLIPLSFNFPSLAKVLNLLFILFAGWFVNSEISIVEYPMFIMSGILSSFGSSSLSVPFMLNSYQIPEDMFQLYMLSGIVNGRFGTLVASMHLIALTLIAIHFMTNGMKLSIKKLITANFIPIGVVGGSLVCMKLYFAYAIDQPYDNRNMLSNLIVQKKVEHKIHLSVPKVDKENYEIPLLDRILERGFIRIGYKKQNLPFTYLNNTTKTIQGFDVQYAHELAESMNCRIEFIPFDNESLDDLLNNGTLDITMSGLAFVPQLRKNILFSNPVMELNLSLVVKDFRKKEFMDSKNLRSQTYKIAAFEDNPFMATFKQKRANIDFSITEKPEDFFSTESPYDGLLISGEAGSAWTLYYPGYSVIIPKPSIYRYAEAYAVSGHNDDFLSFVNQWLKMQEINGFKKQNYDFWILGLGSQEESSRWSVGKDIFKLWQD
ncbi:MAG: cation:dicarboxylase symporter family transporter [Lentisphaeraceae bacterium]|nr:cation:dicarboxylase symporter family transporter [Lentisphaeraceae bacterium]